MPKFNEWILLSATPGDTWEDYIPVFVANGFYKNRTAFKEEHMVMTWVNGKYPKVDRYLGVGRLIRLRNRILVDMDFKRETCSHHEDVYVNYDVAKYKETSRLRWNPYKNEPIVNAGELCYVWRRIVNEDESRQIALMELFEKHPKMIVFYNFDYELDILKNLYYGENVEIAEWNVTSINRSRLATVGCIWFSILLEPKVGTALAQTPLCSTRRITPTKL